MEHSRRLVLTERSRAEPSERKDVFIPFVNERDSMGHLLVGPKTERSFKKGRNLRLKFFKQPKKGLALKNLLNADDMLETNLLMQSLSNSSVNVDFSRFTKRFVGHDNEKNSSPERDTWRSKEHDSMFKSTSFLKPSAAFLSPQREIGPLQRKKLVSPPIGHYHINDELLHPIQPVYEFGKRTEKQVEGPKRTFMDLSTAFNTVYSKKNLVMDFAKQMDRPPFGAWRSIGKRSSSYNTVKRKGVLQMDVDRLEKEFNFQNYIYHKYQASPIRWENMKLKVKLNHLKGPYTMDELNEKKFKLIKKHNVHSYTFVHE
eukprot:TRINITY_DN4613_c0_g1_i1.p1 TRINITY_DN4613_c0_g1~~TRINITY_DN4613_c0_g1_i1.p1  ORF type:complete len:315 (-),score=37.03 TRINITY_DN4613_c0_g1_i1:102-1046(-)